MFASHIMNMKSESMKYTVKEKEKEWIRREVHHLYHDCDVNCASTMLHCLSVLFSMPVSDDVFASALGMHGAGYYRAQCGRQNFGKFFIVFDNKQSHKISRVAS